MTKYTPGPKWTVNETALGGIDIEDFPRSFVVCRTSTEDYPNRAEELEHARLIAAAPELLEAAKKVLAVNDRMERGEAFCYAAVKPGYDALRAAITKAEGG